VDPSLLAVGWPGEPAAVVSAWRGGQWKTLGSFGDLDAVRTWASVTKLVTSLAAAIDVEDGRASLDDAVGPEGSTLAHLLSHSSGLGLEAGDPTSAPGAKRVYSNYGMDLAAQYVARDADVATWLATRVLTPLELHSTRLVGRASSGLEGSTTDLAEFARQWVTPSLVPASRRDRTVQAFLPELSGVVPGWGRFSPCPWGLGPELRGEKSHWMGEWPTSSFGHFGKSGSMVLVNVDEGLVLVATNTVDFGAWALDLWPSWTTRVREWATVS
jgi:CubicO group peptidase (beta-lactamase class C family)